MPPLTRAAAIAARRQIYIACWQQHSQVAQLSSTNPWKSPDQTPKSLLNVKDLRNRKVVLFRMVGDSAFFRGLRSTFFKFQLLQPFQLPIDISVLICRGGRTCITARPPSSHPLFEHLASAIPAILCHRWYRFLLCFLFITPSPPSTLLRTLFHHHSMLKSPRAAHRRSPVPIPFPRICRRLRANRTRFGPGVAAQTDVTHQQSRAAAFGAPFSFPSELRRDSF